MSAGALSFPRVATRDGVISSDYQPAQTGGGDGGDDGDRARRKHAARQINECVKHFNSFANTLGATIIGAAVIIPFVKDRAASIDADGVQWCAIGLLFHILAYVVVFLVMESEE